MMVAYALYGVAALLTLAPIAIALSASPRGTNVVYGASLIVTLTLCVMALLVLFGHSPASRVALPLGLPWLGAHFRIDALAAFFLVVVNLGAAAATCSRSATGVTSMSRNASCRSIRSISPP